MSSTHPTPNLLGCTGWVRCWRADEGDAARAGGGGVLVPCFVEADAGGGWWKVRLEDDTAHLIRTHQLVYARDGMAPPTREKLLDAIDRKRNASLRPPPPPSAPRHLFPHP